MARGRPKANIDREEFRKLCALMCTEVEICGYFGVCEDTLNAWCKREYGMTFSEVYKKESAAGKISIRRAMYQNATKNGNTTAQIFLAKNLLAMSDNPEAEKINRQRLEFEITKEQGRIAATEAVYEDDGFIKALNGQVPDTWEGWEGAERSAERDKE